MEKCKTFPSSFVKKCLDTFPDDKNLAKLLEKGDIGVGSLLNNDINFTPNLIITAFESCMSKRELYKLPDQLVGLYERAKKQEKLDQLFGWFLMITAE